jgi:hypothetical protein
MHVRFGGGETEKGYQRWTGRVTRRLPTQQSLHCTFEAGRNSQPSVNERNASSPWKRLVLNSVKREENRVPPDSNGISPPSRHLWAGNEHTFERSSPSTSERWRSGWVQKGQGVGLGISKSDPGSPPRNPAERVALRVRKTNVRNEGPPAVSRKSRCQPDDGRGGMRPRSKGRGECLGEADVGTVF